MRTIHRAEDATTEGMRLLRIVLRRQTAARLAKRLACTDAAIRLWARGARTPGATMRDVLERELDIAAEAWELEPTVDAYDADPATGKKLAPSTKPRPA